MMFKHRKIHYLIPMFILLDATLTYTAINYLGAKELNPITAPIANNYRIFIILGIYALLMFTIIWQSQKLEKSPMPFDIILIMYSFVITNNLAVMIF